MLRTRRCGRSVLSLSVAALALAAPMVLPAAAEDSFNPLGDGAGYTNPDLLRDPTTGCENCLPNPPHEWDEPPFDIDWSLALRGSFVQSPTSTYFEAIAVPEVTLRHDILRGSYQFTGSAEISRSTVEELRVGSATAGFSGDYQFDDVTTGSGSLDLTLSRESAAGDPTVIEHPLVANASGEASVERTMGQFVFTGRVNGARTMYGPTTNVGPVVVDNSDQNNWVAGAGFRTGYQVTPILTAFVDGSVAHQAYDDGVSPVYLVKLDATDYQARTGLAASWNSTFEAETSVGYGVRDFVDASLGDVGSVLFDASVTYRPDETVEFNGAFTTTFGAPGPDSAGFARLEYAAVGDVAYTVNPWLKLRASAGWSHTQLVGTADTEAAWDAGAGADYLLNEFTNVTADYNFSRSIATPDPAEDTHRVTLGITFHD